MNGSDAGKVIQCCFSYQTRFQSTNGVAKGLRSRSICSDAYCMAASICSRAPGLTGISQRTANRYEELAGKRECQAHRVRNKELGDLEGFVMSPGHDIPAAIENAVIMVAVSASKIERGSARRIGHQNDGLLSEA